MTQIQKEYAQPFELEPSKLTSILAKIHERLEDCEHTTKRDHFEVFMAGERRHEMASLEEVLKLDNSRKHKIQRLLIVCSATAEGSSKPEHEVRVDYGATKSKVEGQPISVGRVVAIIVRSDAAAWASRTLSEIEEQVERTWQRITLPTMGLGLLAALTVLVLVSQFFHLEAPPNDWLDGADLARAEQMLEAGRILTDEEVREVATMRLRKEVHFQRPQQPPKEISPKVIRFALALVALLGVTVTLMTQYPGFVFLWGDEAARHASRVQRRRYLWTALLGILGFGVLQKLLYEGASSWISKQ